MPSLSVCPNISVSSSKTAGFLSSKVSDPGYRQGRFSSAGSESFSLEWNPIDETDAQNLVDLLSDVRYTKTFDISYAGLDMPVGKYKFTPGSFSVSVQSHGDFRISAQVDLQKGV